MNDHEYLEQTRTRRAQPLSADDPKIAERKRCHDVCMRLSHRWFGDDEGGYEFGTAAQWCAQEIVEGR